MEDPTSASPPAAGTSSPYSVGWALTARERTALRSVPATAWEAAIEAKGEVRERRADEACDNDKCGHRACWIEEANVTELTGLLRKGLDGATGSRPGRRRCGS